MRELANAANRAVVCINKELCFALKRAIILKEKPLLAGVRDGNFSKKIGAPSIMIQMEYFR